MKYAYDNIWLGEGCKKVQIIYHQNFFSNFIKMYSHNVNIICLLGKISLIPLYFLFFFIFSYSNLY